MRWFPGHMGRARSSLRRYARMVDLVFEILDARIPASSHNPEIKPLLGARPLVLVLNKADLASEPATGRWLDYFRRQGLIALRVEATAGHGIREMVQAAGRIMEEKWAAMAARGRRRPALRAMVVGIPNVGKSTLINRLAGEGRARTGDRPGITRGKQWIVVDSRLELLDLPGILPPRADKPEFRERLAITGALGDEAYDPVETALALLVFLLREDPTALARRYGVEPVPEASKMLSSLARARGCLLPGGEVDMARAALVLLREFRAGKLGRFTLEEPSG